MAHTTKADGGGGSAVSAGDTGIATNPGAAEQAKHPRPSLMYTIKQVELAARSHMDELLKPAGITSLQYTALTVLRRRDGLSSAQLARNSFVTAQSMSDLVSALERRGLIARSRDPGNRRALLIGLTEAGRGLLAAFDEAMADLEQRMFAALTPRERGRLEDYLNRCRSTLADEPAR